MTYLGLLLGERMLNCVEWNHVINSFILKLSFWKARYLSIEDCLNLIKFVLSSIPIYPPSVIVFSVRVRNSLHSLMDNFFGRARKIEGNAPGQ